MKYLVLAKSNDNSLRPNGLSEKVSYYHKVLEKGYTPNYNEPYIVAIVESQGQKKACEDVFYLFVNYYTQPIHEMFVYNPKTNKVTYYVIKKSSGPDNYSFTKMKLDNRHLFEHRTLIGCSTQLY